MQQITLYILLIVSLILASCASDKVDDNSTIDALSQTVLTAVKYEDPELLAKYFVTGRDLEWQKENFELSRSLEEFETKLIGTDMSKVIEDIRNEAMKEGLSDWSNVTFDIVRFKSHDKQGYEIAYELILRFNNGDKYKGTIEIDYLVKTAQGWRVYRIPDFLVYRDASSFR
ncbi:MAG: hypothetical protein RIF33_03570 [Cyclobacteriaceae bacterium]